MSSNQWIDAIVFITMMNVAALDLNLLAVLDAVLVERNVTRAARRLGLSQPAVSNALARLRERLGDPLVVRTAHGIVPTEFALRIAGPVRQALALLNDAVTSNAPFAPQGLTRTFTLAMTDYAQFVLLAGLLRSVEPEAPGIQLRVVPWPGERARALLEQGDLDVAVGHMGQVPQGLHAEALFDDRFVCIVRRGHPAVGRSLPLRVYTELAHVVVAPDGRTAPGSVDRTLAALGLERKVGLYVPSFLMVPPVVASTDMVAALGERVARPLSKLHGLRLLPPPVRTEPRTFYLLWHARTNDAQAHRWLRDRIVLAAAALDRPRAGR